MQAVADAVPEVLELSRHLVQAQEEERKRISRELHDEAGQGLMVLRLYLGTLVSESPNPELRMKIEEAMSMRSEEHTSELQSHSDLVCRLLLEKKKHQHKHCATYLTYSP